jgi:serine/threonine-protein kinase
VDPGTPYELLKVMDFGLAKLLQPDVVPKVTVTNADFAVGTPGYMCPEQARGEPMDGRGDLYSVGIILYELLTGRLPFAGKSTMEVLLAQVTEEPPPFAFVSTDHGVPEPIEQVVKKCLAKDPKDRPQQARDLTEMYEGALQGRAPGAPEPLRTMPGRSRLLPRVVVGPDGAAVAQAPEPAGAGGAARPVANDGTGRPDDGTLSAGETATGSPASSSPSRLFEPLDVVHYLEAWMPEKIAAYKLRGFIGDVGGDIIESVPGRIRVQVGGKGSIYASRPGSLSWLGLGRRWPIDIILHLEHGDGGRDNQLFITVVFRAPSQELATDIGWRNLCTQVFCDLRAYLMGQSNSLRVETIS